VPVLLSVVEVQYAVAVAEGKRVRLRLGLIPVTDVAVVSV
jgi:hypothetical protein